MSCTTWTTRATATFLKEDGSQITLARSYHEVWKKKRGSSTEEFSGHVTDAYIDGVPVSAGEYKRTMEAICTPEQAKMLTDPRYFAKTLHWEDRRQTLLEMCGDVTDAEVIGSSPDLAELWTYLAQAGDSGPILHGPGVPAHRRQAGRRSSIGSF